MDILFFNVGEVSKVSDVTRILHAIEDGDGRASAELLPLVYDELRRLAAQKMSAEMSGNTLQATALVHEAYVRLVGSDENNATWNSRGHFFAAAAKAMRRILIDRARAKGATKRGGGQNRKEFSDSLLMQPEQAEDVVALDEALTRLKAQDTETAQLVELRFFAGLPEKEAAAMVGISQRQASKQWKFARAWFREELGD